MSRIPETPSRPITALVMPSYCSGSLSSIHTDCGIASAVAAGLGPSKRSGPSSSLTFSKASSLDSVW